ncbi:DsbA family protein [Pararhizobium haloflavum]|uniref:DsbA family protein n=1 Tax=Pararhizobium haloflavum TaxID=2037914 RepID=UPI000C1981F3|nr:DsbA family protein [Pararhizobium haloflavum]
MLRRHLMLGVPALFFATTFHTVAQDVGDRLFEAGPLPEQAFGEEDAPITVIEYASLTCGHCRNFHLTTWPELKEKYVDTGKVRFVIREFPLDPRASAGFMLARCAGEDKWYPTVDLLYRSAESWTQVADAATGLKQVMGMAGMSGEDVEACLVDQELLDNVNAVAAKGSAMGVTSTPTFFVNGEKHEGALTIQQFSEILDPLLADAQAKGDSDEE